MKNFKSTYVLKINIHKLLKFHISLVFQKICNERMGGRVISIMKNTLK